MHQPQIPRSLSVLILTAVTAVALASCGQVEDTRPGQPVKTRQTAFKEIVKAFEPMGVMLRAGPYDAERFAAHTARLIARRDGPWPHFGPDTFYPPTRATEAVWKQPAAFAKEKEAFFMATDQLQSAVDSADQVAIAKAYDALHDTCKSCHRQFKER